MAENKTLAYGDLLVTLTSDFTLRWTDSGSGANRDGACMSKPVLPMPLYGNLGKPLCSPQTIHPAPPQKKA
jgi:hypothetical protein